MNRSLKIRERKELDRGDVLNPSLFRDEFAFPLMQYFDEFFSDFWKGGANSIRSRGSYPKLEMSVENDELVLRAAIPGVKQEDINAEVIETEGCKKLRITGKMSEVHCYETPTCYYHRELRKSQFIREIVLPSEVDNQIPEATLEDGILTMRWKLVSKKEETQNKKIPISVRGPTNE